MYSMSNFSQHFLRKFIYYKNEFARERSFLLLLQIYTFLKPQNQRPFQKCITFHIVIMLRILRASKYSAKETSV